MPSAPPTKPKHRLIFAPYTAEELATLREQMTDADRDADKDARQVIRVELGRYFAAEEERLAALDRVKRDRKIHPAVARMLEALWFTQRPTPDRDAEVAEAVAQEALEQHITLYFAATEKEQEAARAALSHRPGTELLVSYHAAVAAMLRALWQTPRK